MQRPGRPPCLLTRPAGPRLPERPQAAKAAEARGEDYDPRGAGSAWSHSFLQKKPCAWALVAPVLASLLGVLVLAPLPLPLVASMPA